MERTRMAHKVINRLGGVEEATVFGRSTKAPAAVAAAFNSDITYALDADDTLFDSAHFATIVVSSARAEAERVDASGDSLLRAVAVGYDMTARLNLACSFMEVVDGKMKWWILDSAVKYCPALLLHGCLHRCVARARP
ncbi:MULTISPECIES: MmgE/PrpD family protein [Rhodococcus]|nr:MULTISPECIES: MmgE/PrpD family protein [Rhodococcus]